MFKAVRGLTVLHRGLPARLANMAYDGRYELAIAKQRIGNVAEVMDRPRLRKHLTTQARNRIPEALGQDSGPGQPAPSGRGIAPEAADDLVPGPAVPASAGILVTGEREQLAIGAYRGVRILTTGALLQALEQE